MRLSLLLATLLLATAAEAQRTNNYGSIYSRFGLGERIDGGSSMSDAMGGAGTALRSPFANSLLNPALWADLRYADFWLGADIRGVESVDRLDETSRAAGGGLDGLALGLPLYRERLGLTIALRPYSRVDYRAIEDGTFEPDDGDPVPFTTNYEGDGGLYKLSAGLGARLTPSVRVGASVDGYFGTVEYLQRTTFEATSYTEVRSARSTRLSGVSGTLGAAVTLPTNSESGNAFHLGASVALPVRLQGDRVRTLGFSLDRDTLQVGEEGDTTLPLSARIGVAYTSSRWAVSVDALYEPWSSFESDFDFGGYTPDGSSDLQDRARIGGGLQYLPGGANRTARYFSRVGYRLGGYTERAFVAPEGTDLYTTALTAGLSLPTRLPTARLDLGVEAGSRGTTDGNLVRDLFIRATATFHFGESWFVRRRLD